MYDEILLLYIYTYILSQKRRHQFTHRDWRSTSVKILFNFILHRVFPSTLDHYRWRYTPELYNNTRNNDFMTQNYKWKTMQSARVVSNAAGVVFFSCPVTFSSRVHGARRKSVDRPVSSLLGQSVSTHCFFLFYLHVFEN